VTFSIVWVVLAATVSVVAMLRKVGVNQDQDQGEVQARHSARLLTAIGIVYSLVLLAGFLYIGCRHGLELLK
jgi:hypothetical protein